MKSKEGELYWVFSLYGTAIGAGVLFLPIAIGILGIIPAIIIFLIVFPLIFFPHRSLCRFVISDQDKDADITSVANKYFGKVGGVSFNILYLFCILPVLFIYSVGIVNTISDFLNYQLHFNIQDRFLLSLIIVPLLMLLVSLGEKFIIKAMSVIVIPFIIVLLFISLWMIKFWDLSIINKSMLQSGGFKEIFLSVFIAIPIIIFSFNHSPIISSLAVHAKNKYKTNVAFRDSKIISISNILMIFTVAIFTFSTLFSLSPDDFVIAKKENISILSYIANHSDNIMLKYLTPIIVFVAMSKSFFGHYLGVREGVIGILSKTNPNLDNKNLSFVTLLIVFLYCFVISYLNPNILNIISNMVGPFLIILLFFIPVYSIYKVRQMKIYKNVLMDPAVVLVGVMTILIIFYQSVLH